MSSSSSSEPEDENSVMLRQAFDTTFIDDCVFEKGSKSDEKAVAVDERKVTGTKTNAPTVQKSQRYIDHDEIEDNSKIAEPTQDSIYKKMSKRINDLIEFVEVKSNRRNKNKHKAVEEAIGGVRLLSDTDIIQHINYLDGERLQTELARAATKKPAIKRRIIEPDELGEDEKLTSSVMEGDDILQQTETKAWKPKKIRTNKVFNYREKKSVFYLQEHQNEFTNLRKKNNWSESKIANFHNN